MSCTVFLQRFANGTESAVSFREAIDFLAKYGSPGPGDYINEITFPPEEIADDARVIGGPAEGAVLIAFHRPIIDERFRHLVFEAAQTFGFSIYDDFSDVIYVLPRESDAIPQAMSEQFSSIQEFTHALELWPESA